MAPTTKQILLRDWLRDELDTRGWGIRTLAKKMDPEHPEPARRALNRILHEGKSPTAQYRGLIAKGLGIEEDDMPEDADDQELRSVTLEEVLRSEIRRAVVEELHADVMAKVDEIVAQTERDA